MEEEDEEAEREYLQEKRARLDALEDRVEEIDERLWRASDKATRAKRKLEEDEKNIPIARRFAKLSRVYAVVAMTRLLEIHLDFDPFEHLSLYPANSESLRRSITFLLERKRVRSPHRKWLYKFAAFYPKCIPRVIRVAGRCYLTKREDAMTKLWASVERDEDLSFMLQGDDMSPENVRKSRNELEMCLGRGLRS